MSRCYGCSQENCGNKTDCGCSCHESFMPKDSKQTAQKKPTLNKSTFKTEEIVKITIYRGEWPNNDITEFLIAMLKKEIPTGLSVEAVDELKYVGLFSKPDSEKVITWLGKRAVRTK